MTEQKKKREKLTIEKLGASALKAGAAQYEDCYDNRTTVFNDYGPTGGKTISKPVSK